MLGVIMWTCIYLLIVILYLAFIFGSSEKENK